MSTATTTPTPTPTSDWPLERVLFALAGTMILLGSALSALVSPWFLLLLVFVGVNQLLYVAFGACGASIVLHKVFGIEPGIAR